MEHLTFNNLLCLFQILTTGPDGEGVVEEDQEGDFSPGEEEECLIHFLYHF